MMGRVGENLADLPERVRTVSRGGMGEGGGRLLSSSSSLPRSRKGGFASTPGGWCVPAPAPAAVTIRTKVAPTVRSRKPSSCTAFAVGTSILARSSMGSERLNTVRESLTLRSMGSWADMISGVMLGGGSRCIGRTIPARREPAGADRTRCTGLFLVTGGRVGSEGVRVAVRVYSRDDGPRWMQWGRSGVSSSLNGVDAGGKSPLEPSE